MKHIITLMLLSISMLAVANDAGQNRIRRLLAENVAATHLDWRNKNLTNEDFEGLGDCASHVKSLDLSDNSFKKQFPLSTILHAFKNLEELKANNNNFTELQLDVDHKNSTLKTLSMENTGLEVVDLHPLYHNFTLETLDLSDSKALAAIKHIYGSPRQSGKPIDVHVRNVVISEDALARCQKAGIVDSVLARRVKAGCYYGLGLGSLAVQGSICFINAYCVQTPFTRANGDDVLVALLDALATMAVPTVVAGFVGAFGLGRVIAHSFLPNGGKVTAIKFITNSADESV